LHGNAAVGGIAIIGIFLNAVGRALVAIEVVVNARWIAEESTALPIARKARVRVTVMPTDAGRVAVEVKVVARNVVDARIILAIDFATRNALVVAAQCHTARSSTIRSDPRVDLVVGGRSIIAIDVDRQIIAGIGTDAVHDSIATRGHCQAFAALASLAIDNARSVDIITGAVERGVLARIVGSAVQRARASASQTRMAARRRSDRWLRRRQR